MAGAPRRITAALVLAIAVAVGLTCTAQAAPKLRFKSVKVAGKPGDGNLPWAEPRIAVGPDGWSWIVTNRHQSDGSAAVFGARDGLHWKVTPGLPAGQTSATPDVDGDGKAEVVAVTRDGFQYVWNTPARAGARGGWPSFRHDARNTGRWVP